MKKVRWFMTKNEEKKNEMKLDSYLCFALYSANHAMQRVARAAYKNIGLTYSQYLVMVVLWENDEQSVNEIGEKLFLESNTLTPLIKKLETLKLVARKRDMRDERKVNVSLTKKGRSLEKESKSYASSVVEKTGLSINEFKDLQAKIVHLRKHLTSD